MFYFKVKNFNIISNISFHVIYFCLGKLNFINSFGEICSIIYSKIVFLNEVICELAYKFRITIFFVINYNISNKK